MGALFRGIGIACFLLAAAAAAIAWLASDALLFRIDRPRPSPGLVLAWIIVGTFFYTCGAVVGRSREGKKVRFPMRRPPRRTPPK